MKTVLANGCFDVLHVGHIWHLEEARALGDRLIVALTLDHAVNKGPGMPFNPWLYRAAMLRALRCVDAVVPSTGSVEAIHAIKPALFVKGIDYAGSPLMDPVRAACQEVGAELYITRTPKVSSSDIIQRIRFLQVNQ